MKMTLTKKTIKKSTSNITHSMEGYAAAYEELSGSTDSCNEEDDDHGVPEKVVKAMEGYAAAALDLSTLSSRFNAVLPSPKGDPTIQKLKENVIKKRCTTSMEGYAAAALEKLVTSSTASSNEKAVLWFPCNLSVSDVKDAKDFPPHYQFTVTGKVRRKDATRPQLGQRCTVNGKELTVFRYGKDTFYGMEAKCPHMGGPLELGDIEDLNGSTCVRCPWHGWQFNVVSGETDVSDTIQLEVYPVRIGDGDALYVGFTALDTATFSQEDF